MTVDRIAPGAVEDALMCLAFADLGPGRATRLVSESDALRGLRTARAGATERQRAALGVPAGERRHVLQALGVDVVFVGEPGYPQSLARIADPPLALFTRGAFDEVPAVAVVGTRKCTSYGRGLAREYGAAIAGSGWAVVSGLARGIDGAAHEGTVAAGGRAVAVLGSGIDVLYPPEHGDLARRIVSGGGVVCTEYPPGTRPDGWRFPQRNRIIVGCAAAVVVVEAAVKGGALITAELAMEAGVPVFAVPGDVGRPAAEGCNRLIRDGAHPVLDPADLVAELSLVLGPPRSASRVARVGLAGAVPPGGIAIDDLALMLGSASAAVLAEIGVAELAGEIRREGDIVYRC